MRSMRDALDGAATGVAATVLGAGVGHLVAGLFRPAASPPYAVGSAVIDATPEPVKSWAIRTFGSNDKTVLLLGVVVVTLLLAALAGWLGRRHPTRGLIGLAVLVALAAAAVLGRPNADALSLLPTAVTGLVGLATMAALQRELPGAADANTGLSRRGVMLAGGATAFGALAVAIGQSIGSTATKVAGVLPRVRKPLAALPAGLESTVPGVTPWRTPSGKFYRVDTALVVPRVDADNWELVIDGAVEHPQRFTYAQISAMPLVEADVTLTCVSNEVGGEYAGGARWTGVPVRELLARAVPKAGNDQVLSTSVDGYTSSTPLVALTDPTRNALLAIGMNGELLPRDHGYPARLVTPGLYGYVGATKWVTRLTVTTYTSRKAYWTVRGWGEQGPIKPSARIDTPEPLATLKPGTVAIGGTAWAQHQGVRAVQVQIDDGPWQQARLGPDAGIDYWRQWWLPWEATTGQHRLRARCIYGSGSVQTQQRADPFPDGASGYHEIAVIVR
ncbi:molybdopterin-dependent oxidoreductase [Yimella sp. cx-51]|nr:molybdopterin-dependent oxidoreductase [Yimella sp. cx-51]MBD2759192.1 molybdopterin-dependent oxidoreductase [Yimella sp. cx-573]QTH39000.1 molybdopterin-dependent oxidoreductase [Yimella sp. cx-51]